MDTFTTDDTEYIDVTNRFDESSESTQNIHDWLNSEYNRMTSESNNYMYQTRGLPYMRQQYMSVRTVVVQHLFSQTEYLLSLRRSEPRKYTLIRAWSKNCNNVCKILRNLIPSPCYTLSPLIPSDNTRVTANDAYRAFLLWNGVHQEQVDQRIREMRASNGFNDTQTLQQTLYGLLAKALILKSAIIEAPMLPENTAFQTMRGICGNELIRKLQGLSTGAFFLEFAPLSTTIDIETADLFATNNMSGDSGVGYDEDCTVVTYEINSWTPNLFLESLTYNQDEWEVLLSPFGVYTKMNDNLFACVGTFNPNVINLPSRASFGSNLLVCNTRINVPFQNNTKQSGTTSEFGSFTMTFFKSSFKRDFDRYIENKQDITFVDYYANSSKRSNKLLFNTAAFIS
jgi:hypothetical protein